MSGFLNDRRAEAVLERLYALDQSQLQALLEQPPPREQTVPGSAADKLNMTSCAISWSLLNPIKPSSVTFSAGR